MRRSARPRKGKISPSRKPTAAMLLDVEHKLALKTEKLSTLFAASLAYQQHRWNRAQSVSPNFTSSREATYKTL